MTSEHIKRFRTTPEKIAALHIALSDPHVQEALTIIQLANFPVEASEISAPAGLDNDKVVIRKYHEMLGVHKAIKALHVMSTPIEEKPQSEPEVPDFYDYLPKELQPTP